MIQTLSDAELEVMNAIWEKGVPVTVSKLVAHFSETKKWKVQTVATFVVRLMGKGFLTTEKVKGIKTYTPRISKTQYDNSLSRRLLDTVYGGSVKNMVISLLDGEEISPDELNELRKWLEELK